MAVSGSECRIAHVVKIVFVPVVPLCPLGGGSLAFFILMGIIPHSENDFGS